jgi:glucokinase
MGRESEVAEGAAPAALWVGVDVGGTNVRAGVEDGHGHLLSWVSYPHRMAPGQFHAIAEAAASALEEAGAEWADVAGVGVGIAGLIDSPAGVVMDAGNLGWHGLSLGPELSRQLGVPVVIENDVCSSALSELAVLPGGPALPWLYVSIGTGVGACLVLDADEGRLLCLNVGHLPVPGESRPCACGKHGCLETVASGAAFTRAAAERIAADPGHSLNADVASLTGKDVVDAALQGDALCLEVLAAAGATCGHAVANLVNLFLPAGVGLAGGMLTPGSPYLVALLDAARDDIAPWLQAKFQFHCARVGEEAGVKGVVELARRRLTERARVGAASRGPSSSAVPLTPG